MNDPFKEKDRMKFYSTLNDVFLDMSNTKYIQNTDNGIITSNQIYN